MSVEPISAISTVDTTAISNAQAATARAAEEFQANMDTMKAARTAKYAKADATALFQAREDAVKAARDAMYAETDATTAALKRNDAKEAEKTAGYAMTDAATYQKNKDALEHELSAKTDEAVVSRRAAGLAASLTANLATEVISKDEAHQAVEAYQENKADHSAGTGIVPPHINIKD